MATTQRDLDGWRSSLSNWGRWGPDDRAGTLNFVTDALRADAARSVATGRAVACSRPIDATAESDDAVPPTHVMLRTLSPDAASDFIALAPHGYGVTHVDALGHFSHDGLGFNGVRVVEAALKPTTSLGVDILHRGLFTRGVLLDIPRLRDAAYLEPGDTISPDEIEHAAVAAGISIQTGDALLVRTGRWARREALGAWDVGNALAGLEPGCLPWLHASGISILGSDGVSDVLPTRVTGTRFPIHEVGLVSIGLHLLDNLDLEPLAATCAELGRWSFLFTLAPLAIARGTASPVNPIAVF